MLTVKRTLGLEDMIIEKSKSEIGLVSAGLNGAFGCFDKHIHKYTSTVLPPLSNKPLSNVGYQ